MLKKHISCRQTGYFSELICDYAEANPDLASLYGEYPSMEGFQRQASRRKAQFPLQHREVLAKSLKRQYQGLSHTEVALDQVERLLLPNTFTVVTGHQLNLFTGPLYFLYKIASTIKLCRQLKEQMPEDHFVPVYWMATEDHDFEEINFFRYQGKKFQWQGPPEQEPGGAVGALSNAGLEEVLRLLEQNLGPGKNAKALIALFRKSYIESSNLSEATRILVHELFGQEGLVIIDANSRELKNLFVPYLKRDVMQHDAFRKVGETVSLLQEQGYKIQVNPREINLFYLGNSKRNRIEKDANGFLEVEGEKRWSPDALIREIEEYPENFSPNVLLRPLYQEVILPNLCYIGGGGELAYWLELKSYFEVSEVPFPVLLLRNSFLLINGVQDDKLGRLGIGYEQLFLKRASFINRKVREISEINIDLEPLKNQLKEQFAYLYSIADQTDASFLGAVGAQERKQVKGLEHLEKRLLKAQRLKLADQVERMTDLQNELFPGGSLQERTANFSEFYEVYGPELITGIMEATDPLKQEFTVLILN